MNGVELKGLRLEARLTQEELAGRAGITASTIGQFEHGIYTPNRRTVRALRRGLGIEPAAPIHAPDGAWLIELADGRVTAVDAEDFERFNRFKWKAAGLGYAHRQERDAAGVWRAYYLHREILGAPQGVHVHHRDEGKLNNRRANLKMMKPAEHLRLHRRGRRKALARQEDSARPSNVFVC